MNDNKKQFIRSVAAMLLVAIVIRYMPSGCSHSAPPHVSQIANTAALPQVAADHSLQAVPQTTLATAPLGRNVASPEVFWAIWKIVGVALLWLTCMWCLMLRFFARRDRLEMGLASMPKYKKTGRFYPKESKMKFADVGGAEEAKSELQELVSMLRNPAHYKKYHGKISKGVLMTGEPGNGKTLLATAVAGEAGVPMFTCVGSEFVKMYVGTGHIAIDELWTEALKYPVSIIFIDEADGLMRHRSTESNAREDDKTLITLLDKMDGFDSKNSDNLVIVIAATNRPDVLDPGVMRPGRFDRQVVVEAPSLKGRQEIIHVGLRDKPLGESVAVEALVEQLALQTSGFSGAEIMAGINEACVCAASKTLPRAADASLVPVVSATELSEGMERAKYGAVRSAHVKALSEKAKWNTCVHEAGHAVLMHLLGLKLVRVTSVPRGKFGGYAQNASIENGELPDDKHLFNDVVATYGGRAATQLLLDTKDVGISSDLREATRVLRRMVTVFGMSEPFGLISTDASGNLFDRNSTKSDGYEPCETEKELISKEMRRLSDEAFKQACKLVEQERTFIIDVLAPAINLHDAINGEHFLLLWNAHHGATATAACA